MKRYLKVRIKRMLLTTQRDLRAEGRALLWMLGNELGKFGHEFVRGIWEVLTGTRQPARRRSGGRRGGSR